MRDEIKMDKMEEERDRWLAALDETELCSFASSFRNGDQCRIFKPRERGAFNVCFFVEFDSPRERWVVRIPIPSCVPKSMWDEKTEIELATMRYVSAKTTIPIPRVHGYAFSDTGPNGLPCIIIDYVEGKKLTDLRFGKYNTSWSFLRLDDAESPTAKHLYRQLADVYVQLRQLEFPQIGALGLPSRDTPAMTCNPDDIRVCHRPLSIEVAQQELYGLEPGEAFPPKTTMATAKEFVDGLLWLADNKLDKEYDQRMDEVEPASVLYTAHHFKQFVRDDWVDLSANEGPFVLVHGDMDNVIGNLLFDDDFTLVGIVDWEWSRVVPAQFMVPPVWLLGMQLKFTLIRQASYNKQVSELRAAVREREEALGLPPLLSTEWEPLEHWFHTAVVIGLNYPEDIPPVHWELIFTRLVPKKDLRTLEEYVEHDKTEVAPRLKAFIEASEERRAFMERKIQEQLQFFGAE